MIFRAIVFEDRRDAGRVLAPLVAALPDLEGGIVLGLPRGGVPVAYEVARAARLPLDLLMVHKLGAPGQRELAIGAVASGGIVALNAELVEAFHLSEASIRAAVEHEQEEIARRESLYREGMPALRIDGRTVVLVDDGLATGATMRAAARVVRSQARRLIVAVPVAASSVCEQLQAEADRVVCAAMPEPLESVGQYYRDFSPTSDEEVRSLLVEARGGC
ncbi:MAG: phosphoribosyltransferase [Acidobacteriota bacterium]